MNINTNYKALLEGRMSKSEFLRQARQGLPQYISNCTSFDDAVKILKQKSLLSEELVYQNKADKFPLESIQRGIVYELEEMEVLDVNSPSREEYKKARIRAIDNLCKDPLYYINKVAAATPQPKEDASDKMQKVNLKEAKDLAMHKDINMNADPGSGVESPVKKASKPRVNPREDGSTHNWTVNDYKLAYILADFGKKGLAAIGQFYSTNNLSTMKYLANRVIGTTDAGLSFAVQGMKKVILGEEDTEWLQSYFHNSKSIEAYNALTGKDLQNCIGSLEKETASEEEIKTAVNAQEKIDRKKADDVRGKREAESKAEMEAFRQAGKVQTSFVSQFGSERGMRMYRQWLEKHPEIKKYIQKDPTLKEAGVEEGRVKLDKDKNANVYGQIYRQLKARYPDKKEHELKLLANRVFSSYQKKQGTISEAKYQPYRGSARGSVKTDAHPTWKEHKEVMDKMLLKETVINLIGKILNEAATTNLAQLSDENASVAELPAAINNLENIVTEIESFWLKEQQKIQGVFDSLGNIKNEDGLPIGYKFVQPIMASLQKDLQPVLAKINLEGINLPEAPAPDQTPVNDPNNANPVDDPNAAPEVPEKKTVFSPAEKEPLQEGKKNRRYTK